MQQNRVNPSLVHILLSLKEFIRIGVARGDRKIINFKKEGKRGISRTQESPQQLAPGDGGWGLLMSTSCWDGFRSCEKLHKNTKMGLNGVMMVPHSWWWWWWWCPKSSLQFSVVEEWVLYLSTLHIQKETIVSWCKDWLAGTDQFEDDGDDDLGGFVCNLSFHYTSDTIYRPQIFTGWGTLEASWKGNCNSKNQGVEGMWNKRLKWDVGLNFMELPESLISCSNFT